MPTTRPFGIYATQARADDRRHVVLAMAFETDAAQHDHLVVALDLLEGLLQDGFRILAIAAEPFLEGLGDAGRRFLQAIACGVLTPSSG